MLAQNPGADTELGRLSPGIMGPRVIRRHDENQLILGEWRDRDRRVVDLALDQP